MKSFSYIILFIMCFTAGMAEIMNTDGSNRKSDELKKKLTPLQYHVTQQCGTEPAFTGKYYNHKETGVYKCVCCGKVLFKSGEKFDSGTGWPSFSSPATAESIGERQDGSSGMTRTEIVCSGCGSHLGHVFNDGPDPTGLRYCINSASLDFEEKVLAEATACKTETATFGAGCFWCTEAVFETLDGVLDVRSGYAGGLTKDPTYKDVSSGDTGHAEVSQIVFDPEKISYEKLLEVFWGMHDPTSLNRQGADEGTQYRSVIFYHSDDQKNAAIKSMKKHQKTLKKEIVTALDPMPEFYEAESYHQDYYRQNKNAPYCRMVIAPKLKKLDH